MTTLTTPDTRAASWDEIVRSHSAHVLAHAYVLTGNRADAEDLAQDVFVRAFCALATTRPTNVGGWLRRITQNLHRDRVRRQRRIQFVLLPDPDTPGLVDPRPHAAEDLDQQTFDGDVRRALQSLTARTRAAVVLCDIDGLTYDEIANLLGVAHGTVRSRIHRGRRLPRSALADRAPRTDATTRRP
jgi:RNA polymerase sigma-70 factor (ECF subfamily)